MTGAALAATVAIGYAACTLVFVAFPDSAATFLNALFHGLDFGKLQQAGGFSLAGSGEAVVVLALWAFLTGALFAAIRNLFGR
jgi:hypothetical protein